ncbi:hypothetical protein ACWCQS_06245 [Streptomyces sp. NPDC002076]
MRKSHADDERWPMSCGGGAVTCAAAHLLPHQHGFPEDAFDGVSTSLSPRAAVSTVTPPERCPCDVAESALGRLSRGPAA